MNAMKLMAIAVLFVGIQTLAKEAKNEAREAVYEDDGVLAEGCCRIPDPCFEKIGAQCEVVEQAPGACIKRTRVTKATDLWRAKPVYNRTCQKWTPEEGTVNGDCCPLKCPCEPKCAPKCCKKTCCPRVKRCCTTRRVCCD